MTDLAGPHSILLEYRNWRYFCGPQCDDFSYNVAENPVHVRDLHATVMHLMEIHHHQFTHRFQGLDFRRTGVEESRVVDDLIA